MPFPPIGGVLQRSHNLLVELSKHHDVDLVSFVQRQPIVTHFQSYEEGIREARKALLKHCARVDLLPIRSDWKWWGKRRLALSSLFSPNGYTVEWLADPAMHKLLNNLPHSYDVIHFDTISLAQYAPDLNGLKVLNHHNIESQMMLRRAERETSPALKLYYFQEGRKLRRYEARTADWFDLHLTCSELDGKRLQELAPRALFREVPNGVSPEFMNTDFVGSGAPSHLLFAGRFSAYANQAAARRIVDDIWPAVKQKIGDAQLTLAGSGPGTYLLRHGEENSDITVTGFVEDIKPYFRDAGIFVCPIDDGGGTRLKILDAMAMGTPVVAHPVACEGLPIIDRQHALLATTTADFVNAIISLYQDDQLRIRLSQAARKLVEEQFSYPEIGKAYANTLSDLRPRVAPTSAQ